MRIAYLINGYPSVSHSFIRREILALQRQGVDILRVSVRRTVNAPDPADQREVALTHVLLDQPLGLVIDLLLCILSCPLRLATAACEAFSLARGGDRGLIAHVAYLLEACRLARLLHLNGITHIHAHFGTNAAAVALLTSILTSGTYSFTVHGPEEFDRPLPLKLGRKIERAAFVVAISSFARSQLMRWCPQMQWSKLCIVRCGLDREFLEQGETGTIAHEGNLLVCVGRLCEQKGQLLLIEAVARLIASGSDVRLVLAGDGPMRRVIEQRVAELGLHSHVSITGWLSGAEVKLWLQRCKAMVLPSFAEGLPVVIMEAFAMRRPVITTYVAGIPELVEDGRNGWLIPAGSVERLAEVIQTALAASDDEIGNLGSAARAAVLAKHDVDREATWLNKLFVSTVAGVSPPPSRSSEIICGFRKSEAFPSERVTSKC